jgi:hypothetical protein
VTGLGKIVLLLGVVSVSCHHGGEAPSAVAQGTKVGQSTSDATAVGAAPKARAEVAAPPARPALSSSSAVPAPGVQTSTPSATWELRLLKLYSGYSKAPDARAAIVRELFAPRVRRFLGRADVSVEQVVSVIHQFFRAHPNPYYLLERPVEAVPHASGTSVRARVSAKWEETCPEVWAQEGWICQREQLLDVRIEADGEGRIVELVESRGPRRKYRALVDAKGYDEPHSRCEEASALTPVVDIAKGAVIEATGSAVLGVTCGPCEGIRQFKQGDVTFWAVASGCFRIYDEATGPHTGFEDFLELVQ